MTKVAIYARVSTTDKNQDPETQLLPAREYCKRADWEIAGIYIDKARAKDFARRVQWAKLLEDARRLEFKVVLVFRLDRAFRSVRECVNTVGEWYERGIAFKSLREDVIDTTTSQGRFVLHVMAAVAELESSIISDRVSAGIDRYKAEGGQWGRKPLDLDITLLKEAYVQVGTIRGAVRRYKELTGKEINPGTAYRYLKGVEKDSQKSTPAKQEISGS